MDIFILWIISQSIESLALGRAKEMGAPEVFALSICVEPFRRAKYLYVP